MAKEKKTEPKAVLEREYIVPLRRSWLKVPKHRRTPRAMRELKMFIAKHMKVENRDIKKVKLDRWLNNEMWFRGIKKPPAKIKIKAIKQDDGIVKVSLVEIPKILQYRINKEKKLKEETDKKKKQAEEAKKTIEEAEKKKEVAGKTVEEKKETEEKEKATVEASLKQAEKAAKQVKHETAMKSQPKRQVRKALKK